MKSALLKRLKKGTNMLEFVLVVPAIILALNAVVEAGVMAYQKAAAQSVSYSATVTAARYGLDPVFSINIGTWADIPFQPLWDHIDQSLSCNNTRVMGGCSAIVSVQPSKVLTILNKTTNDYSYFMTSPFISDNAGVFGNN